MTLIIAAQGEDFLIVAADSRETVDAGAIRVEVNIAEKLVQLTKHTALLFCGDAGHAQYLVSKFQAITSHRRERGVTQIAEEFSLFCQEEALRVKDVPTFSYAPTYKYFPNIGFVLGGLDKIGNRFSRPMCYGLASHRGYRLELGRGGFVLDGKPMLARYLFAHYYKPNMDVDSLSKLIVQCLYDTSRVDGDVGGKYKMAIIDHQRSRPKEPEEIDAIIDEAQLRW